MKRFDSRADSASSATRAPLAEQSERELLAREHAAGTFEYESEVASGLRDARLLQPPRSSSMEHRIDLVAVNAVCSANVGCAPPCRKNRTIRLHRQR